MIQIKVIENNKIKTIKYKFLIGISLNDLVRLKAAIINHLEIDYVKEWNVVEYKLKHSYFISKSEIVPDTISLRSAYIHGSYTIWRESDVIGEFVFTQNQVKHKSPKRCQPPKGAKTPSYILSKAHKNLG